MTAAAEPTTTEAGFIKPQQSNLVLIPWDPQSPEHVKRMFQQRVACKWDSDQVAGWQESAKEGVKWFYWIVCIFLQGSITRCIENLTEPLSNETKALLLTFLILDCG